MPKICRSMLEDGGKPKVGPEGKMLGVRVAPDPRPDIAADANGNVHPHSGGMSVAPHWRELPSFLIPKRLKSLVPDACGSNKLVCWTTGQGEFVEGNLNNDLRLRPDPKDPLSHGFVEPAREMKIDDLQLALATRAINGRKMRIDRWLPQISPHRQQLLPRRQQPSSTPAFCSDCMSFFARGKKKVRSRMRFVTKWKRPGTG